MRAQTLPHDSVYARLGRSLIHGIGVIAIRAIPAGTNVFSTDQSDINWVRANDLEPAMLDDAQRSLYHDFAIRRGDQLGCPQNFNLLTVGWYVNEPAPGAEPNLTSDSDLNLVALRNIEVGEELTLLYSSYDR